MNFKFHIRETSPENIDLDENEGAVSTAIPCIESSQLLCEPTRGERTGGGDKVKKKVKLSL
jgi:hypothetical protein